MASKEKTNLWSVLPIEYFQDQKEMLKINPKYFLPYYRSIGDTEVVKFLEFLLIEDISLLEWDEQNGEDDNAFKKIKKFIAITPGNINYAYCIGFVPKASKKSNNQ